MSPRRASQAVYWRRRLVVLVVLVVIVWLAFKVFGGGNGGDEPAAKPPVSATPTAPPVTAAPVDGKISVSLASGTDPCDAQKVLVAPSVEPGQFAGGPVKITMSVSTTESKPCVLDAKSSDLLVVISADKKPVWDSTVCKTALLGDPVSVTPQWSTVVETTWSGRGSGTRCSSGEGFVGPGTYVIKSATLGGDIGKTAFHLSRKPKPTASATTATPSGKPSAKPSTKPSAKPSAAKSARPGD